MKTLGGGKHQGYLSPQVRLGLKQDQLQDETGQLETGLGLGN